MPSAASPLPRFCAAYIRVSTDDQAELSPETQLEEIRKYAQREGIILLQEQIYIDSGISGKKAERRPGLESAPPLSNSISSFSERAGP